MMSYAHYWVYLFLLLLGLFTMMFGRHLLRKLIGMYLLQTAIILFYMLLGVKWGGTVPILREAAGTAVVPELYMNPVPHTLMLTAIVVGISTTGVSLALLLLIHRRYQTLDEDKILDQMQ